MAQLTPIKPNIAGTTITAAAASAGGDAITNPRGTAWARIANASGSSITVTIKAQQTARPSDGSFPAQTLADQTVAVGAGASKLVGPFLPAFVDGSGLTQLTYSAVTSLTVEPYDQP